MTKYQPEKKSRHVERRLTAFGAVLVQLVSRYMKGLLDPTISLLEVHKLMYFMQVAGEPLRLKYIKCPNGPYSENLRYELRNVEGHLISGDPDGRDAPDKALNLVLGAVEGANAFLQSHPDTHSRFGRVDALIDGFETPFGLELLATVHWIFQHDPKARTNEDLVAKTYAWNDHKRQFSPRQIGIALKVLAEKGWIHPVAMA